MNWTLIAVLAILLINFLIGLYKGLIKMVYSVIVIAVVTIVTSIFAPMLASYLKKNTSWDDSLQTRTESYLEEKGILKESEDIDISDLPLPFIIKDKIAKTVNDSAEAVVDGYNQYVVKTVSSVIFSAIVYIVVFLILLALTSIIGMLLDVISKLPVLKEVNKLAGAAVGLAQGLLLVWVLAIFIMMLSNFSFADYIYNDIDDNVFLKFLYDKNLIMYFVTRFLG